MKRMVCPSCKSHLNPKTLETESGSRIEVNHCPFCGGVWFDHFEVNRLSEKEVNFLFSSTSKAKSSDTSGVDFKTSTKKGSGKCPRCNIHLERLRAESIPADIEVLACPKCKGNFFSQKDLKRFKEAQKAKLTYFKTWNIPLPSLYAVLIPLLILAFLTISIPLTIRKIQEGSRVRIKASQIIISPTIIKLNPESVILTFGTTYPAKSFVEYEGVGVKLKKDISTTFSTNHTIELSNLKSKTTYSYRLFLESKKGEKITSEKYFFTTPGVESFSHPGN